jgi:hypothetical protein
VVKNLAREVKNLAREVKNLARKSWPDSLPLKNEVNNPARFLLARLLTSIFEGKQSGQGG